MTPGVSTDGMPDPSTLPCFSYHQDSGMEKDLEYRPAPRFSMKAGCESLTIHTCFQLTTQATNRTRELLTPCAVDASQIT